MPTPYVIGERVDTDFGIGIVEKVVQFHAATKPDFFEAFPTFVYYVRIVATKKLYSLHGHQIKGRCKTAA